MHRLVLLLLPAFVAGCGSSWGLRDEDGDGKTILDGDCWDSPDGGGDVGPEAAEVWYDGVDQNCDGKSDYDKDGDGVDSVDAPGGTDCWDDPDVLPEEFEAINGFAALGAADVFPGAADTFYDGVDQNCDGASDFDQDGDGYDTSNGEYRQRDGSLGDDCYDAADVDEYPSDDVVDIELLPEEINAGATDTWYDGTDQDCDAWSDFDQDHDGFNLDAECNDEDPEIYPNPEIPEVWYNDEDENCDGNTHDKDLDGHASAAEGAGDDCWDDYETTPAEYVALAGFAQPSSDQVFPGAVEVWYDGVDGDCGSDSDFDQDGDSVTSDTYPDRTGALGLDCDDGEASTYPGADDTWYDGIDSDCAGNSDYDLDGDGFDSEDQISTGTDCDDNRAAVNPAPTTNEVCSTSYDDNCDGSDDLQDATGCLTWFLDTDGDGYGTTISQCWCEPQATTDYDVANDDDCDDAAAGTNPGEDEICDAANTDEDCDGTADNNDASALSTGKTRYYHDDDEDGFGDEDHAGSLYCDDPSSSSQEWVTDNSDCDDVDAFDYPGATESIGNGDDENCDGSETCYDDDDDDGYLDTTADTRVSTDTDCLDANEGRNTDPTTDCDDASATDYPGATETIGNGDDEDCDGGELCYDDDDNDGFLDATADTRVSTDTDCADANEGTNTDLTTDCDDASASDYPGATETVGNQDDEDCDGGEVCYNDDDNDGFLDTTGDTIASTDTDCTDAYEGTSSDLTTDCDDASATDYPGATETIGNGDDEDCDGGESCYNDDDNDGFLDSTGDTIASTDTDCTDAYEGTNTDLTTDCDDASATDYPGATETVGNGDDEDCDGGETCYDDDDNDGYLDTSADTRASADSDCADANEGTNTDLTTDCDDNDADQNPGETELCNDVDDDCDGSADEGLTVYYTDADDDDYGTGIGDCSITSGITNATDCDDADEWVFPGAAELCDGQQNDCNDSGWVAADENDTVSFVSTGGLWSDATASFDDTTASTVTLPLTGTYYFCPGTYNAKIEAPSGSNVSLVGFAADAATTIIDNNTASGSTVSVTNATLNIEDLTITGGHGTGGTSYGGGLLVDITTGGATPNVTLTDCVVSGNVADRGAGIAVYNDAWVELVGTTVEDNTADQGGGIYVSASAWLTVLASSLVQANDAVDGGGIYATAGGTVEIESANVYANIATGNGGGIRMGSGPLTLTDAGVYGNTATDGGGIWIDSGDGTCDGAAIWGNTASDQGGGVYIDANTGTFAAGQSGAAECDFAGTTDNAPNDVEAYVSGAVFNTYALYTATATFLCDAGVCDPAAD